MNYYRLPPIVQLPGEKFTLRKSISLDGHKKAMPRPGWTPSDDRSIPLGKRLPIDWSEDYYGDTIYAGRFEPATAYANLIRISNCYAGLVPDQQQAASSLIDGLIDHIVSNTMTKGGSRFVVRNYDLDRKDHIMKAGWVNGISNGFIIRGLCRVQDVRPTPLVRRLIRQFLNAYKIINNPAARRPRPWFSYVDEMGCLWFDEHPCDDGTASLVLNGHIHALYGLYYGRKHIREPWIDDMLQAAIWTVKIRGPEFRVPGNIPKYDLRPGYKRDYAPARAVRQMMELFRLTGDVAFSELAEIFRSDIDASNKAAGGNELPRRRLAAPPFSR